MAAALALGLSVGSWPAQANSFSVEGQTKAQAMASAAGWNLSALPIAKFTHEDLQGAAAYANGNGFPARAAVYTSVGRPNFAQYVNGVTLPDPESAPSATNRITVNNAGIKSSSVEWESD
jgi:hypothetical protein